MCTQLKIHDILNKIISLIVPEVSLILTQFYFLLDGPGVSFITGIVCPQASQMCCDKCQSLNKECPLGANFSWIDYFSTLVSGVSHFFVKYLPLTLSQGRLNMFPGLWNPVPRTWTAKVDADFSWIYCKLFIGCPIAASEGLRMTVDSGFYFFNFS